MEENNQALDQNLVQQETQDPDMNLAGSGKRIANMFIDLACFYALTFAAGILLALTGKADILSNQGIVYLISFSVHFIYHTSFELFLGKTVGKLITRTHVVDIAGGKITFAKAAGRSLCRFIPFDAFSFLGSSSTGWHDTIPGTRVVNDR